MPKQRNIETVPTAPLETLTKALHPNYAIKFREGDPKHLVIAFSPTSRFAMFRVNFAASTLYIADQKLFYYLLRPGQQTGHLHAFIKAMGYEKVSLVGSSKGGTGSLLWSALLSQKPDRTYHVYCQSFSPQSLLFPRSKVITFPSYLRILHKVAFRPRRQWWLRRYGDLARHVAQSQAKTTVYYSGGYEVDCHEALRLPKNKIELVELPLPFHGAVMPYIINRAKKGHTEGMVRKMFSNAKNDQDLAASLPDTQADLIRLLNEIDAPHLDKAVADHANTPPQTALPANTGLMPRFKAKLAQLIG